MADSRVPYVRPGIVSREALSAPLIGVDNGSGVDVTDGTTDT